MMRMELSWLGGKRKFDGVGTMWFLWVLEAKICEDDDRVRLKELLDGE